MGRSQREKGKRGELEARDVFLASGVGARRSANQACREPGDPDLALDVTGWFVEAKNGRAISIPAAVRQAREAAQRRHAADRVLIYAHWTAAPGEHPVAGIFVPNDADGSNPVARWIAPVEGVCVSRSDLWLLILSTIRYSLPRQSYIVGTCGDLLRAHGSALTGHQLRQIAREIQEDLELRPDVPEDRRPGYLFSEWTATAELAERLATEAEGMTDEAEKEKGRRVRAMTP